MKLFAFLAFLVLCHPLTAAPCDIQTIAGGSIGDGFPANTANLASPGGLAMDAAGNLYIADYNHHRIRKVDTITGTMTTIAGSDNVGFSGMGGQATSATLFTPLGVVVDSSNNLFISEEQAHRVLKVDLNTGIINLVAGTGVLGFSGDGGPAISAKLDSPGGLAVDSANNLYIADRWNHRVRKVNMSTGIIDTVVGSGNNIYSGDGGAATSAGVGGPYGVAVDAAGNIYISDSYVRKIDISTGIISLYAGGLSGFSGDGGPATSAGVSVPFFLTIDSFGNLFFSDNNNQRIRKVEAATGFIYTVAGNGTPQYSGDGGPPTSASLNNPRGIVVDTTGRLLIGDTNNFLVRAVDSTGGTITSFAGNGYPAYRGDGGIATNAAMGYPNSVAIDSVGNLFISDKANQRVRKVDAATGIISTVAGTGTVGYSGDGGPATAAQLHDPAGLHFNANGDLYIADSGSHRIRKIDALTGFISTFAGNGLGGPQGDGGQATAARLYFPGDVIGDTNNHIYISDGGNVKVRVVDTVTGIISTYAGTGANSYSGDGGPASAASFFGLGFLALDSSSNLYVGDINNNRVRKINSVTGIIQTVAGNGSGSYSGDGGLAVSAGINKPLGIVIDGGGNLYICENYSDRLRGVNVSTGIITTIAGSGNGGFSGDGSAATAANLVYPAGLGVDLSNNLYLADGSRIRKIFVCTPVANPTVTLTHTRTPNATPTLTQTPSSSPTITNTFSISPTWTDSPTITPMSPVTVY